MQQSPTNLSNAVDGVSNPKSSANNTDILTKDWQKLFITSNLDGQSDNKYGGVAMVVLRVCVWPSFFDG